MGRREGPDARCESGGIGGHLDPFPDDERLVAQTRTIEPQGQFTLAVAIEKQAAGRVKDLRDLRQQRIRFVMKTRLKPSPLAYERQAAQRWSVGIRQEDDRLVVAAVRRQVGQHLARVDVLIDESGDVLGGQREASAQTGRLAYEVRVGPVEGVLIAPVDAKAANRDPGLERLAGRKVVDRPVVGGRTRRRGHDVDAIAPCDEALGQLTRLTLRPAGQVTPVPGRDHGDPVDGAGYLRSSTSRRSLCSRWTSFSSATSRCSRPRVTASDSRIAAISEKFTWR